MYAGLVADTRTWYDALMALPIANYAICVLGLQIQDPQANMLLSKSNHHDTTPIARSSGTWSSGKKQPRSAMAATHSMYMSVWLTASGWKPSVRFWKYPEANHG